MARYMFVARMVNFPVFFTIQGSPHACKYKQPGARMQREFGGSLICFNYFVCCHLRKIQYVVVFLWIMFLYLGLFGIFSDDVERSWKNKQTWLWKLPRFRQVCLNLLGVSNVSNGCSNTILLQRVRGKTYTQRESQLWPTESSTFLLVFFGSIPKVTTICT